VDIRLGWMIVETWIKLIFMRMLMVIGFMVSFGCSAQDELRFDAVVAKESYFTRSIDSTLLVGDTVVLTKGKLPGGMPRWNIVLFDKNGQFSSMKMSKWCKKRGRKYVMLAGAKLHVSGTWEIANDLLMIWSNENLIELKFLEQHRKQFTFIRVE
jgi:hypothetical protein